MSSHQPILDEATLDRLRSKIYETITPLVSTDVKRICLLDPPGYANVGDCAILLGEFEFLRRAFPQAVVSIFDIESYSDEADAQIDAADVLFFQGGGNFGDIWPRHQVFRNHILSRFPGKRAIQFPQSIHFSSQSALEEAARIIERHGNLTMLVRDHKSFARAQASFACDVQLCPDMAFAMKRPKRLRESVECFCLLRSDKEVLAKHDQILEYLTPKCKSILVDDWVGDKKYTYASIDSRVRRAIQRQPSRLARLGPFAKSLREAYARERLAVGVNLLSKGHVVVTDRLHAHIISCILGIPNAVFNSLDGKVNAFHETWLADHASSKICADTEHLGIFLEQHLGSAVH